MTTVNLKSSISSISQLQGTCNTIEQKIFEKLTKLEAAQDVDGNNVTEATFNGGTMDEFGNRKLTEGPGNTAFIKNEVKSISIV